MIINSGKGMRFYQPPGGGGGGGTLNILIDISAKLDQLKAVVTGLEDLNAATVKLSHSSAAEVAAFGAVFDKVADGIVEASKKAGEALIHLVEGFVERAAELQTEQFPLIQLLRENGAVADEVLGRIHGLWQDIGVISSQALGNAARNLLLMNVPAENLVARLIELGKAGVATGNDIEMMTGAYMRFRQGIETHTAPAVRGVQAFGSATTAIFKALRDSLNLTNSQIREMIEAGQLSFNQLNGALRKSAEAGGVFANAFVDKRATFEGAVKAMETAWQGLQVTLGKPLIDWATPILERIKLIIQAFNKIAEERGWQDALKVAWIILIDEIRILWQRALSVMFGNIAPAFVQGWNQAWEALNKFFKEQGAAAFSNENIKQWGVIMGAAFSKGFAESFGKNFSQDIQDQGSFILSGINAILQNLPKGADTDLLKLPPETPEETHRVETAMRLSAELHKLEAAMNAVRQEQTLISQAPFMGVDAKRLAEINSLNNEMNRLNSEIRQLEAIKGGSLGPLNPAQLEQVNTKLEAARNRVVSIQQSLLAAGRPLQAELQRWADSFGNVFQQVGKTIEGTVNVALQSLNQWLVTGKFNAQALLQQIVMLGLQLVEQLIIQRVVAAINQSAAVAQAKISAPIIAAAYTPAATAVTIATEGQAAASAPFEIAAALALAEVILGGSSVAHEGGRISRLMRRFHGGGLAPDEVPIIAQTGEIMIRRDVAQAPGMSDFLLGLNSGEFHRGGTIKRFHSGSWIDVSGGEPGLTLPSNWAHMAMMREMIDNPVSANFFAQMMAAGFGTSPSFGPSISGPTMIPTTWRWDPGMGVAIPHAVAVDYSNPLGGKSPYSRHTPRVQPKHGGGVINRFHDGGQVGEIGGGAGGVHIYAFTDLRALTKHMASKDGKKIIFDTVKGRRIDLGIR